MTEASPTAPEERIVALDALRGLALLGILVINVRVFAMPEAVLTNPTVYGDFTGANYAAWLAGHVLAEQTFLTLFSALFGAGVLLFTASKSRDDEPAVRLHLRRTAWLFAIGLGHAYLLWYGDILVSYAICGVAVVAARDWTPAQQARVGLAVLAVPSLLQVLTGLTSGAAAVEGTWEPAAATLEQEVATYRGGWLEQMEHRVPTAFRRQTAGFLGATVWRVGGVMLLGMALLNWGVFTNDRSDREYRRLALGTVAGAGVILAGVAYIEAREWAAEAALFWLQFNYWGSLLVAVGYVGLMMVLVRRRPEGPVTGGLAAVGRTAFTNYLLQTVLATSIFYGHGLGLFGRVSRVEALGVVTGIWALQVPLSVLWLRRFRYGPVEWVWRWLTYGRREPLGRDR